MYSQIDSNRRKSWILIAVFVALLAAVGWVYGYVVSDTGPFGLVLALGLSFVMTLVSWYGGDKIALATSGAKELTERAQFPTLWNIVENLAITAGIQKPRIYIIEDDSPNAFATGRDPQHSSIAVTTGLLARLEKVELEGVLAHELSHVKNYDSRVMMLVIVLVGAIALIGDYFIRFSDDDDKPGPLAILGIIFIILSPVIANLIKLAVSRKREYLADASGALLTRYPEGLASALEKIGSAGVPLQKNSSAINHLWVAEPGGSRRGIKARIQGLFSTHPPIDERIAKLRQMVDNKV